MTVTVQLPDTIAAQLGRAAELPRHLLEALAADCYRTRKLTRHQVSQLLELDYWQTDEFLTRHDAHRPYTAKDLEIDRKNLAELESK